MADSDLTLKQQIEQSKYVFFGMNVDGASASDPWHERLLITTSNDGVNWEVIENNPDLDVGAPDVRKFGDYYYIICTYNLFRTTDWVNFEKLSSPLVNGDYNGTAYSEVWAPEFIQDHSDQSWHIVYGANNGKRGIYLADFDENTGVISNPFQPVNVDCASSIDPDITYYNGTYYLWLSGARLFTSTDLKGEFTEVATNIINDTISGGWYEAPEMMIAGDYAYLYQDRIDGHVSGVADSGYMVVRIARVTNLTKWSEQQYVKSDIGMRHGCFRYNPDTPLIYPDWSYAVDSFNPIVTVKDILSNEIQALSCIEWSSFYVQWEQNSTYQLQFTAYDDGSLNYQLLNDEAIVTFDGQQFVVKNVQPDYSNGTNIKQIQATHIYSEVSRTRQYNVRTGTLTYQSPKDVLAWYFDNNPYNVMGFSYNVYGDWASQQITDLGNNSGKDALSQICSTWTNAIILPNNREINVYSPEAFRKNLGKRIDYLNNAEEVKPTIDSTAIVNKVKCYGKELETTSDNSTTQYYFEPFFVYDQDSIDKYGVHLGEDINDDRFTDAQSMKNFALGQLVPEPTISIEITGTDNEKPVAGEQRHLKVEALGLDTTVTIVGFTWYPFAPETPTTYEFDNLSASILNSQSLINNKLRNVASMVQQALNKAKNQTTSYISYDDPQTSGVVKTGDIWVKPLDTDDDTTN